MIAFPFKLNASGGAIAKVTTGGADHHSAIRHDDG
jgi:hypothetical protein